MELIANKKMAIPNDDSLGNIYRRRGDLVSASLEYERLHRQNNGSIQIDFLHSIFNQKKPSIRIDETDYAPAPFIKFDDFLDRESNKSALDYAFSTEKTFTRAGLHRNNYINLNHRTNLMTYDVGNPGNSLLAVVRDNLPFICDCLNLSTINVNAIHLKITAYLNGHFFRAHQDKGEGYANRLITFVYFFHQEPKPYKGGDLLLYDSRMSPRMYKRNLFTRIIPQNNSIVFFPSEYFHEVLPVETHDKDFRSSRFTMTGHIT